jgi:predicted lipid-binding transport protein (Tim44 family)
MKNFALMAAALVLGFTLSIGDAEAKRLGGGSSSGMQRQSVAPSSPPSAAKPAPTAAPTAAPAPAAQPKRSWMGPLAGLAAGLGLAALASHFGFGEGLANVMMIGLLIMGAVMLFGFLARKKAAASQPAGMQYAGAGAGNDYARPAPAEFTPAGSSSAVTAAVAAASTGSIPADFDVDAFVRNAKVNFIRLQAANDAGNIEDIREFTTPEMFGEIKLAMAERGTVKQETDVVQLNAEVLDVAEEASRYIVSIRFSGLIREEKDAAAGPFDEIWNMTKPRDGSRGWTLAGIQQVQ